MTEKSEQTPKPESKIHTDYYVAPSPHIFDSALTTQRMMIDVLLGLTPLLCMAIYFFHWYAVVQVGICIVSCVVFEAIFTSMRRKPVSISDCSAVVTGAILGLSLPWSAPWYIGVIGSMTAIGLGKVVFGGLGYNIFNPAMVGRAFVMVSFPMALGASAYVSSSAGLNIITEATPLTAAKMQTGSIPALWPLFLGSHNGSLGETSALACLLGGSYLCLRRSASWQIPLGVILSVAVLSGLANLAGLTPLTMLHHLAGGALLFGAFFIATDPVSSPITPKGKFIFGAGVGLFVVLIRVFSGYPEGVMFAVLLMNSTVPLINRGTIPRPFGGPAFQKV